MSDVWSESVRMEGARVNKDYTRGVAYEKLSKRTEFAKLF